MRTNILSTFLVATLCGANVLAQSPTPSITRQALPNGLRLVVIHFPGSTNVSIFTFAPLGATAEGTGQAQWSHLVEHLVIRSTVPKLSAEFNAETLSDHLRLDSYGTVNNWLERLAHHRRWLEGIPFTEATLDAEKPRVNQECDNVARRGATHKFALHAWNQGYRFGRTNIAVKGDASGARLEVVQRFRDARLAVSNRVTVCIVGGIEPDIAVRRAASELAGIRLAGTVAAPMKEAHGTGHYQWTWDLDARHLLLTWPIPGAQEPDYAGLHVAAPCLMQALASDGQVRQRTLMALAGADLRTPEGTFFYVSAALSPDADFDRAREALLACVARLATNRISQAAPVAAALAAQLTEVPSLASLKSQLPRGIDFRMVEGNLGLQLGIAEYRYGDGRLELARRLAEVGPAEVARVVQKYLSTEKAATCMLAPSLEH